MEDQNVVAVGWTGPVSTEAVPVLKPEIVEEHPARLRTTGHQVPRRPEDNPGVASPRLVYQPHVPRLRKSMLDSHVVWLTVQIPEIEFNSAVFYREQVTHFSYTGVSAAGAALRPVAPYRDAVDVRDSML